MDLSELTALTRLLYRGMVLLSSAPFKVWRQPRQQTCTARVYLLSSVSRFYISIWIPYIQTCKERNIDFFRNIHDQR